MPAITTAEVGLGSANSRIKFYLANRPPIDDYPRLDYRCAMTAGEIAYIVANTSNHWRKLFNVCAKFLFDYYQRQNRDVIAAANFPENWQAYRDLMLFQADSQETLLFSAPPVKATDGIHIIAGKTYAASLNLPPLVWLDNYFAINTSARLIVSPYPDYRQLSNERIARLLDLVVNLESANRF